jgi:hypothetical protein
MQVGRDIIVGLHYFFGAQVSHMALKRPKQGKAVAPFKPREMLDLTELSASAAEKFREAMQQVAGKVRYTGSPYHRSSAGACCAENWGSKQMPSELDQFGGD